MYSADVSSFVCVCIHSHFLLLVDAGPWLITTLMMLLFAVLLATLVPFFAQFQSLLGGDSQPPHADGHEHVHFLTCFHLAWQRSREHLHSTVGLLSSTCAVVVTPTLARPLP